MSRKGRAGKKEMRMGLSSKEMFRVLFFAMGVSLLLPTLVATAGVGTPANFENSGIYGGYAMSFVIDPNNPDVLYVGMGSGYGVYKSTDAGTIWSGKTVFDYPYVGGLAVAPSDSDIVFASSGYDTPGGPTLKKSTDGGSTWTTVSSGGNPYAGDEIQSIVIHPTNPLIIYLGSGSTETANDDAKVWKTEDGGTTWTFELLSDAGNSEDTLVGKVIIDPNDPDTLYAVTGSVVYTSAPDLARGNIFKSINAGAGWSAKYPDGGAGGAGWFADVCVDPTNSNIVFAAGKVGIVKSINGGGNWITVLSDQGGNGFCSVVVNEDDHNIVYAGEPRGGNIFKSIDGGTDWTGIYSGAGVDTKLFIDPVTTTTLYAIDSCGVMKSIDSGDNWTAVNNNIDAVEVISSVVDPTNSDVMYVGTESGYISKTTDKGSNWTVVHKEFYGITALAIDPNSTDIVYAGDRGTSILKTIDGGNNWTDMMAGEDYQATFGFVNPSMMMVDPEDSSNVYLCQRGEGASPNEGNIYKSTNGGATWSGTALLPANNPVWSMAIKASDSNTVYVGRDDNGDDPHKGVVKTIDGGNNWESVGLTGEIINCLVIGLDNEDVLYAGTEGGKVYRTIDAGATWTDITPNGSSGAPFEAILTDSSDSNIVYVGSADGCLYKSTDAGSSWTLLTDDFVSVKTLMLGSLYAGTGGGLYKYSPGGGGGGGGCFLSTTQP